MKQKKTTVFILFALVGLLLIGTGNPMTASAKTTISSAQPDITLPQESLLMVGETVYYSVPQNKRDICDDIKIVNLNSIVTTNIVKNTYKRNGKTYKNLGFYVKGRKSGTTTIQIRYYKKGKYVGTISGTITVIQPKLSFTKKTLYVGDTIILRVNPLDSLNNVNNDDYKISSIENSNEKAIKITKNVYVEKTYGKNNKVIKTRKIASNHSVCFTALKETKKPVTIKVKVKGYNKVLTCKITVKKSYKGR